MKFYLVVLILGAITCIDVRVSVCQSKFKCNPTLKTDEFNGLRTARLSETKMGRNMYEVLEVATTKYNDEGRISYYLMVILKMSSSDCFNRDSSIDFLMEDNTVVSAPYIGEIDCSRTLIGSFDLTEVRDNLTSVPMKKIRVHTSDGYSDIKVNKNRLNYFIDSLSCLESAV